MASVVGVLSCDLDGVNYQIVMDAINDTTINATSQITDQPLISGDFVSDHLFRKPISLNISGTFGLGNHRGIVVNDGKLTLVQVEQLFERIKNEGVLCSIVRMHISESKDNTRFMVRNNLVLNSISWTEKIDTLGFNFSFKEIGFATSVEYEVDIDDENMPNVMELSEKSFNETLFNTEETMKAILKFMLDSGIMKDTFAQQLAGNRVEWFVGLGLGAVAGYIIGSLAVVLGASGIVGWIIGVVVVVVAVLTTLFVKIARANKYKIKPFDKYSKKEVKRWSEVMQKLIAELDVINTRIKVFQPTSDADQECILSVDGSYFVFDFTTNNLDGTKTLDLINYKNEKIKTIANIGQGALRDFSQCTSTNSLYTNADTQTYIHLIYVGEETTEEQKRLQNYMITISSIPPEDYAKKMAEIMKNYLLK